MWLYDRKALVPTGTDRVDHEGNTLTRVRLLVREAPTKRINKRKMRSAASPNVIHSMDGSHLQRSEEHTSELQSLMRISYAVFSLKKKKQKNTQTQAQIN